MQTPDGEEQSLLRRRRRARGAAEQRHGARRHGAARQGSRRGRGARRQAARGGGAAGQERAHLASPRRRPSSPAPRRSSDCSSGCARLGVEQLDPHPSRPPRVPAAPPPSRAGFSPALARNLQAPACSSWRCGACRRRSSSVELRPARGAPAAEPRRVGAARFPACRTRTRRSRSTGCSAGPAICCSASSPARSLRARTAAPPTRARCSYRRSPSRRWCSRSSGWRRTSRW